MSIYVTANSLTSQLQQLLLGKSLLQAIAFSIHPNDSIADCNFFGRILTVPQCYQALRLDLYYPCPFALKHHIDAKTATTGTINFDKKFKKFRSLG
jgi:hypothetical protein